VSKLHQPERIELALEHSMISLAMHCPIWSIFCCQT